MYWRDGENSNVRTEAQSRYHKKARKQQKTDIQTPKDNSASK
jgi:hypothetical protein